MPACPHCHEYYFGNPTNCPKCNYNFKLGVVQSKEEAEREMLDALSKNTITAQEKHRESLRKEEMREKHEAQLKIIQHETIGKNPLYEYTTEVIPGAHGGLPDMKIFKEILLKYSADGWKLHSSLVYRLDENALGSHSASRSSFMDGMAGVKEKLNATVFVFERCVKPAEY